MKRSRLAGLCVILAGLASPIAAQTTIDFNDGTQSGSILGFYSGLGVTFVNARWDNFFSPGEGAVGVSGLKFIHQTLFYGPQPNNPIIANFSSALTSFSVRALNVGFNGARIDAFDIGGNLLGSAENIGPDELGVTNHPLLSISQAGIRSVRFYQPRNVSLEGMLWDNITFRTAPSTVVPEPSTYVMMATGLLVLGSVVRRRSRR
jgi:hypothetical protein